MATAATPQAPVHGVAGRNGGGLVAAPVPGGLAGPLGGRRPGIAGAGERSRALLGAALAAGGLDKLVHAGWPDGRHASLRRLVCDLLEEYGRHTGHADLLRDAVGGLVGEDPPAGWRPQGSRS